METNKIYKGDCYELIKQIPDHSVDLIITDPPYELSNLQQSGILRERKGGFTKEILEAKIDNGFNLELLKEFVRVMKKINIYMIRYGQRLSKEK